MTLTILSFAQFLEMTMDQNGEIYSGDFAEDHLPVGQQAIKTSNLRELMVTVALICDSNRKFPAIGIVTGVAGTGKSVAINYYISQSKPRPNTWLPAVLKVKVKPGSTPKALVVDMLEAIHERPKGLNVYRLADEIARGIIRNATELIVVDEADRLTEESFDVLRHIHDKTGCNIVIVGLPDLIDVIESQDKFASRVAPKMQFKPLPMEEIHSVVLPQMVFTNWRYSPDSEVDRALGERIWKIFEPSLRNVRNMLQIADQMASFEGKSIITRDTVDRAIDRMASTGHRVKMAELDRRVETGTHELHSERQKEAKVIRK